MSRSHIPRNRLIVAMLAGGMYATPTFAALQPGERAAYQVLYTFNSAVESDDFGAVVDGAGDVNNDGFADLIVGAYRRDNTSGLSTLSNAGFVQVFSGQDGSPLFDASGTSSQQLLGFFVSKVGDLNSDNHDDFIYSSPGSSNRDAVLRSGIDGSVLHSFPTDPALFGYGFPVDDAGDVNNDGVPDIVIGGRPETLVFSGADFSELHRLPSPRSRNSNFETRASGAGDINGDGVPDIIVGTRTGGSNPDGYARVFVSQIVPEPGSLSLLGFGALGLAARRRSG